MKSYGTIPTVREVFARILRNVFAPKNAGSVGADPPGEIYGYAPNPSDRPVFIQPPELGVEFELTIMGDNSEHKRMVPLLNRPRSNFHPCATYKYKGPKPKKEGRQTRRFKLIKVGYRPDVDGIRREVVRQGMYVPEPQWLEAFRLAYPIQGERPGISIANPYWEHRGVRYYPVLHCDTSGWYYDLDRDGFCSEHWAWLVGCE
ncbi:MAG: hypothetical protein WCT33_03710 [Patescibacteria group bacterium]